MAGVELIYSHFPKLSDHQKEQFEKLFSIYEEWNAQINVVSRKDFEFFYERHVLHALGIAKVARFKPGTEILDVGTGGGFPGIPLAILFPQVEFHLVDSIGKKIKVVQGAIDALGLTNVKAEQIRAEEIKRKYDFVVSRAVTQMEKFIPWIEHKFKRKQINAYPNGIFYLKGGDLKEELKPIKRHKEVTNLSDYFEGEFFETKKVVYIKMI